MAAYISSTSYRCYFQDADLLPSFCFGSLDPQKGHYCNAQFTIETHTQDLLGVTRPSTGTLSIVVPSFKSGAARYLADYPVESLRRLPKGTHNISVIFCAGSFVNGKKEVISFDNDENVPEAVKKDARYGTAVSTGKLFRLTITWTKKNMMTRGFMNSLSLESISNTAFEFVVRTFRHAFSKENGTLHLYVLDSYNSLPASLKDLSAAQRKEDIKVDGPLIRKFYKEPWQSQAKDPSFNFDNLNCLQLPALQPNIKLQSQLSYTNVFEMCTRKGVAVFEVYRSELDQIEEVRETVTRVKAFQFHQGSPDYLGVAHFGKAVEKRFAEGDMILLAVDPKTFDEKSSEGKWRGIICHTPRWAREGDIAFLFSRPSERDLENKCKRYNKYTFPEVWLGQAGFDKSRTLFMEAATFRVQIECDKFNSTVKAQINGVAAFLYGAYLGPAQTEKPKVTGQSSDVWIEDRQISEEARFWCLNDAKPPFYNDLLGPAYDLLKTKLVDSDQLDALKYLTHMPAGRGIINGAPGAGKSWFMAQIIAATHATDTQLTRKTVVVTPSNHAADVAAKLVTSAFRQYPYLDNEYVLRPLGSSRKRRTLLKVTKAITDQEIGQMIQTMGAALRDDDGFDMIERIARYNLMAVVNAFGTFQQIQQRLGPNGLLLEDEEFQELQTSVGYMSLVVCGYPDIPRNKKYSAPQHQVAISFRGYFSRFISGGGKSFASVEWKAFARVQMELMNQTVSRASVLISTPATLASYSYGHQFVSPDLTMWLDEAGKLVFPEFASAFSNFRPKNTVMVGDIKQLKPPVTIEQAFGCVDELKESVMESLLNVHWPSVYLFYNRRSAAGLIDIPSRLFYESKLKSHPTLSIDMGLHEYTQKWKDFLAKTFPGMLTKSSPILFLDTFATTTEKTRNTKSSANLNNAALIINVLEKAIIEEDFPPSTFAIIAMYSAQVAVYKRALRDLTEKHPNKRIDLVEILTVDSYQGGGCKITLVDLVATTNLGFLKEPGRLNVAITRAEDGSLVTLSSGIRDPPPSWGANVVNWPMEIYRMAFREKLVLKVLAGDPLLEHPCVERH